MRNSQGKLDILSPSKVTVLKSDGRKFEDVDAGVQSDVIFFNEPTLPLEAGDIVQRLLPSGLIEEFEITDPCFYPAFEGIPAHFQSEVRRRAKQAASNKTREFNVTYNLHGANARVNIQSSDNSINFQGSEQSVFNDLRALILEQIPSEEQSPLLASLGDMEAAAHRPTFKERYREFIALSADYIGILSPLLPVLSTYLHH